MEKKYFVLYLIPCRADFAQTMSAEELSIMHSHISYWNALMKEGKVIAFGPVLDPKAIYGMGIVAVEHEQQVQDMISKDPASKINKYEYYPFNAVVSDAFTER